MVMETLSKYRKKSESDSLYKVHYNKSLKVTLSHQRFVVPWQLDDLTKGKEEVK